MFVVAPVIISIAASGISATGVDSSSCCIIMFVISLCRSDVVVEGYSVVSVMGTGGLVESVASVNVLLLTDRIKNN